MIHNNKLLRVLMLCPYYYPATAYGGPVWIVKDLAKGLKDRGVDVEIFTTSGNIPTDDQPRTEYVDGTRVHYAKRFGRGYYFFSPELEYLVSKHIERFDILHIHGLWSHPVAAGCVTARAQGKPYVIVPGIPKLIVRPVKKHVADFHPAIVPFPWLP